MIWRIVLLFLLGCASSQESSSEGSGNQNGTIIGVCVAVALVLFICIVAVLVVRNRMMSNLKIAPEIMTASATTVKDFSLVPISPSNGAQQIVTTSVVHLKKLVEERSPLIQASKMATLILAACGSISKSTAFTVDAQSELILGRDSAMLQGSENKKGIKVILKLKTNSQSATNELTVLKSVPSTAANKLLDHIYIPDLTSDVLILERGELSLEDYCRTQVPDLAEIKFIFSRIGQALLECHQARVVHADITPWNIYNFGHAKWKLISFGAAYGPSDVFCSLKGKCNVFTSPELLRLESRTDVAPLPVTKALDIYSYGLLLYECLSGRRYFGSLQSARAAADAHQDVTLEIEGLDEAALNLVEMCTNSMANLRPGMESVLLHRFFSGQTVTDNTMTQQQSIYPSPKKGNRNAVGKRSDMETISSAEQSIGNDSVQSSRDKYGDDESVSKQSKPKSRRPIPRDIYSTVIEGSKVQWRRGQLIGQGAFGKVYLGLDMKTGKHVAVKEIQKQAHSNVQSLMGEIEVMKRLEHVNIVRYLGTQEDDTSIIILMEYVSGGSIDAVLQKFGKLTENLARMYASQALRGLVYLHACNIVHRDIKAANMLCTSDGIVKLSDFGASKILQGADTADGEIMNVRGTPYFLAPEVIRQNRPGRKSDVWSFGCTVLQMITGQPPWSEKNFTSAVHALFHIATTTELPYWDRSGVSGHLSDFVIQCLEREQDNRPTASQLLEHIWFQNDPTFSSGSNGPVPGILDSKIFGAAGGASPAGSHITFSEEASFHTSMNRSVKMEAALQRKPGTSSEEDPVKNNEQVLSFLKGLAAQRLQVDTAGDEEEEDEEEGEGDDGEVATTLSSAFADLLNRNSQ